MNERVVPFETKMQKSVDALAEESDIDWNRINAFHATAVISLSKHNLSSSRYIE